MLASGWTEEGTAAMAAMRGGAHTAEGAPRHSRSNPDTTAHQLGPLEHKIPLSLMVFVHKYGNPDNNTSEVVCEAQR